MDMLAWVSLADSADTIAGTLPYTDERRVGIARAMVLSPAFVLLDEPAAGMSDAECDDLMHLDRRDPQGPSTCGVLLIEHNMSVIMGVCHRIHVLDGGRTIAEGLPARSARTRCDLGLSRNAPRRLTADCMLRLSGRHPCQLRPAARAAGHFAVGAAGRDRLPDRAERRRQVDDARRRSPAASRRIAARSRWRANRSPGFGRSSSRAWASRWCRRAGTCSARSRSPRICALATYMRQDRCGRGRRLRAGAGAVPAPEGAHRQPPARGSPAASSRCW